MVEVLSQDYFHRHGQVRKIRGKASAQNCVHCLEHSIEKPAYAWAQIHTEDGMDAWADYVPLCQPCHMAYDGITGSKRSAATRKKMSQYSQSRTETHLQHLSQSLTGRVGGMTGKKHSFETRKKMSESQRRRFEGR